MFRDNIRQFADEKVRPLVKEMDEKGVFDQDLIHQFFQLGLMGIEIPGAVRRRRRQVLRSDPGGGGNVARRRLRRRRRRRAEHAGQQCIAALGQRGAEETLPAAHGRRHLRRLRAERSRFRIRRLRPADPAELKGSDYVLNGRKLWITNGKEAGLFVLFATVDPAAGYKGITAFLIEKEFPGFTVGKKEDKLGIRASSTCELILEDCRVPKSNVLGEVGKGYKIAIETLNEGRIGIGAQMAGVARGAWEYAAKYAQERKQFGKPISDYQGIQFQIAQMATEIEAARLMVYNAARMKDAGIPFVKEAAMTKLFCSQVAERVTSLAIEIYGGYGFTKDYPVEKYWRDSKIGKIYEGTSNMQLATIAKLVMGGK